MVYQIVTSILLFLVLGGASLLLMIVALKFKYRGKVLCFFLDADLGVTPQLVKSGETLVKKSDEETQIVTAKAVRWMRVPMGWPPFLQEPVRCLLFKRGTAQPLDWVNVGNPKIEVSAVELSAILDPQWMAQIVKGAREGTGESRLQRVLPLISAAVGVIVMVLLLVVLAKLGVLEEAIRLVG